MSACNWQLSVPDVHPAFCSVVHTLFGQSAALLKRADEALHVTACKGECDMA